MGARERVLHELRALGLTTAYFAVWLGLLILLKWLILAEYQLEFPGLAKAVTGTLILSKVVLLLERVPLGLRAPGRAAWVDVVARTLLYAVGVFVVLLGERLVHALRHGASGLLEAFAHVMRSTDVYQAAANTLVVTLSLLVYNFLDVLRLHLGSGGLLEVLRQPVPRASGDKGRAAAGVAAGQ